jgi:uncharacterized protein with FMN-binding domain
MKTVVLTLVVGAAVGAPTSVEIAVRRSVLETWTAAAPRPPGIRVAANTFIDGTYTGTMIDTVWGVVQVQALVKNGQIASLKMLRYPNERRESLFISQLALPRLRDEAVRTQSANVDIVSGATPTSQAFIRSLDAALKQSRAVAR